MPRVTFNSDFDWAPPEFNGRWLLAYKAGTTALVTTPCAAEAIATGKAYKIGETAEPRSGAEKTGGDTAVGAKRSKTSARSKRR